MDIRIATRRSTLALWQAEHVAELIRALVEVESVTLVPVSTQGDQILDRSLQKIGGKGLFIKELEVAMQAGDADIAVHSMKDMPVELTDGFCIAAVLPRGNAADALVGRPLTDLPDGARIGSSSLRRAAQLKMLRPDLQIDPLRGNINTRLAKLGGGEYDAIVLAAAGLERLGLEDQISQLFTPIEMLPAVAQGVIGIECPAANVDLRSILARLNDQAASRTTLAERTVAKILQADCQSPVAVHAVTIGSTLTITALVATPDGTQSIRDKLSGPSEDAEQLATQLAQRMIESGAQVILAAASNADV
ncbi:MAG: hydroxymethylbilane synthase [Proteobacteria bacterium]|nr:hydroxymethylbilane synthase [Pseudomonadota bacterium]